MTLFYLEPLPERARIRVTFNADGLNDVTGKAVDADGNGQAGGSLLLDFDTLANGGVAGTVVTGRVFASELAQAVAAHGQLVNRPLAGVRVTVDGREQDLFAVTDATGNFRLEPAPAGPFFVHIDGRTVSVPGGGYPKGPYYPFVGKEWVSRIGEEVNIGNVFLPLIQEETLQPVSATSDTTVSFPATVLQQFPGLAGVQLTVPANSLFADDGKRGGLVGIAPVPPDRLPSPLPPGLNFPLVITVQTDGASNFDRPVPVCFPNLPDPMTGFLKPPGAKSALWSFNHDLGDWEVVGPMTVSADGKLVCSDPGTGILQPGWHGDGDGNTASGGNTRNGNPGDPTRPRPGQPQECAKNDCPCDGTCRTGREVYLQSGEEVITRTDLMIPGRAGMDFIMDRTYRSKLDYNGPLGFGWNYRYNEILFVEPNGDVVRYTGRSHEGSWTLNPDGSYTAPAGYFGILTKSQDGTFMLTETDGFQRFYRADGRVVTHMDRFGNRMLFDYDAEGNLHRVIDVFGREIQFVFQKFPDGVARLVMIEDFTGRQVRYEYDANGDLVHVTTPKITGTSTGNDFPNGRTERYTYSSGFAHPDLNHNMLSLIAPEEVAVGGPPHLQWTYGTDLSNPVTFDRVLTETEGGINASGVAAGGTMKIDYGMVNENAKSGDLDIPRGRARITERNGNIKEYFVNERQLHIITRELTRGLRPGEPEFYETRSYYDDDGQLVRRVFPEGNETRYAFDTTGPRRSRSNLIEQRRVADPDRGGGPDLVTTYTYEPLFNQILTVTEPRGNDAAFAPPLGERSAARYTKRFFYDYQESSVPLPLATLFGINLSGVPRGLGDLNGDGRTDQMFANLIRVEAPSVHLPAGSNEAARRGAATQTIVSQTQWNDRGQVTARIDPEGKVIDYAYHPERDPSGSGVTTFSPYVALSDQKTGYLRSTTVDSRVTPSRAADAPAPTAIMTLYRYDAVGNLNGMRDPRGVWTEIEHNQLNEVVAVIKGADVTAATQSRQLVTGETAFRYLTRFYYDHNGRVVKKETENRGGATPGVGPFVDQTFQFDILNNLLVSTTEVDANRQIITRSNYDPNELLTRITRGLGNQVAVSYDERNLPMTMTHGFGSPEASTVRYDYDLNGNRHRITDAEDNGGSGGPETTFFTFDGFDRVVEVTDPLGNRQVTVYDPASNPVRQQVIGHPPGQPDGAKGVLEDRHFRYDELNRLFRIDAALFLAGGFFPTRPPSLLDGNADGFVTTVQEYDALSRMTFLVEDDGEVHQTRYDGAGRRVATIDALGNAMMMEYDLNSYPVRVTSHEVASGVTLPAEQFSSYYVYDQLGRLVRVTDNAGQTSQFLYDSRDNIIGRSDPQGPSVQDPLGVLKGMINSPGNTESYVYDGLNRRIRSISDLRENGQGNSGLELGNTFNADGRVTVSFQWDDNSRLTGIQDDNGNLTTHAYDALDRKTSQRNADGTSLQFVYDRDHNIVQITDPNGTVLRNSYDVLNRLLRSEVTQRAPGVIGTAVETYEYDGLSRLTRSTDDNGDAARTQNFERTYDSLSRMIEERQNGRAVSTTFSGDARPVAAIYPGGRRIDRAFDGIDRVKSQSDALGLIAESAWIGPSYRELERAHGNGTAHSFLNDLRTADTGYDAVQRRIRERLFAPGRASALIDREYAYNRVDHRTSETRHDDAQLADAYTYDSLYRIVRTDLDANGQPNSIRRAAQNISYALDGVGNRRELAIGGALNPTQVSFGVNEMNEYVNIGLAARAHSDNGNLLDDGHRLFAYDHRNRLVSVRRKSDQALLAEYLYDTQNRRRTRVAAGVTTHYFYNGWQVCEEQNGAGQTETTFLHSPTDVDGLLQMERTAVHPLGAARLYLHQNARHDVVAVTDASGAVIEKRYYDDFGRISDHNKQPVSVSAVGNPFGFQGRRLDPETGLYYFRNRYYDPETGRFLQRDPVWDPANMGNQYAFVGNSPASRVDPYGLQTGTRSRPPTPRTQPRPSNDPTPLLMPNDAGTAAVQGARGLMQMGGMMDFTKAIQQGMEGANFMKAESALRFAENMSENFKGGMGLMKTANAFGEADAGLRGISYGSDYVKLRQAGQLPPMSHNPYTSAQNLPKAQNMSKAAKIAQGAGTALQVAEVAANAVDYYRKDERVKKMSSNERDRILNEYERLAKMVLEMPGTCKEKRDRKEKLLKDLQENMEFQLNNVSSSQVTEHLVNAWQFFRDSASSFIPVPTGWLWNAIDGTNSP